MSIARTRARALTARKAHKLIFALAITLASWSVTRAAAQPTPHTLIDAALEGQGPYKDKAYFFAGDYYVRYDMLHDRVDGAPTPTWNWPLPFPYAEAVDATLTGQAPYAQYSYFFKNGNFVGYDWNAGTVGAPSPLSNWSLPGAFAWGVDAAVNGQGPYYGYSYFFRGDQYVTYRWATNALSQGERPISAWNLPVEFNGGIDAALTGTSNRSYIFKNDKYVIYSWTTASAVTGAKPIAASWPGLVEMVSAARGATEARKWIAAALVALRADLALASVGLPALAGPATTALATHFHVSSVADRQAYLPIIIANFEAVENVLKDPRLAMRFRNQSEATADHGVDAAGTPYPAYAFYQHSTNYTTRFPSFGPKCQAAMVLHETVHYVDIKADAAHDFYEHLPVYATLTPDLAAHNPSSYASYAAHVLWGSDVRWGAMHPNE